jgi:hypothetical protein
MIQSILSASGRPCTRPTCERGLAVDVAPRAELHVHAVALDTLDHGLILSATTVEHR